MEKIVRWSLLNIFLFLKRTSTLFLQLMKSLFLEELSSPSSPAGQPFKYWLVFKRRHQNQWRKWQWLLVEFPNLNTRNESEYRVQQNRVMVRIDDRLDAFLSVLILKLLYWPVTLKALWNPGCILLMSVKSLSHFQLCVTIKAKLQIPVLYRKLKAY